MIEIKIKQNFNFEKLIKNVRTATSVLLNDIAKPIKDGWDKEITQGSFSSLENSTESLHGSHKPLNLTGKLAKSNKIIKATPKKLKAVVKNTAKSTKSYKIRKPNGKIYRGTRKSDPVFYGYYLDKQGGFKTSKKSLIKKSVTVPQRDFTSKTINNLEQTAEYKAAQTKFAKNLDKSMKMASK